MKVEIEKIDKSLPTPKYKYHGDAGMDVYSATSCTISAGSWKVIAEGRESGSVGIFRRNGQPHTVLINKIIAKIKPEQILWEAPVKTQQVWFINLFGENVNLGNIAPHEVIPLECLRLGLRGDTFFNYLPDNVVIEKKQKIESEVK